MSNDTARFENIEESIAHVVANHEAALSSLDRVRERVTMLEEDNRRLDRFTKEPGLYNALMQRLEASEQKVRNLEHRIHLMAEVGDALIDQIEELTNACADGFDALLKADGARIRATRRPR